MRGFVRNIGFFSVTGATRFLDHPKLQPLSSSATPALSPAHLLAPPPPSGPPTPFFSEAITTGLKTDRFCFLDVQTCFFTRRALNEDLSGLTNVQTHRHIAQVDEL